MKGEYDWSTRCGIGGTEEENKTNDGKKEVCIIDKETMTRLRDKPRPKLIEYLDREQIPYDARTLIRCPHCGEQATAYDDGTWYCNGFTGCRQRGDVVDYAMTVQGKEEPDVLRYLARMFGIKITELEFVTSDEVMDMEFSAPVFVVDQLIPRGLSLFCGQSKIGKSWLALWLAHRISTGQAVWGFPVRQCEVMYLCLEDELLPGDLGCLKDEDGGWSHVLIFAGYDEDGTRMWVHCTSGSGVVLNTPSYADRLYYCRPNGVDYDAPLSD